jgi:hypothetical protein
MPRARGAPPVVTPRNCYWTRPSEAESLTLNGIGRRATTSIQDKTLARITIISAILQVLGRNREVIRDLLPMPNRGSPNTFSGQGFSNS